MPKPPVKNPGDEILSAEWNQGWDWMQEGDGAGTNADMVDGKHVVDLWSDVTSSATADWNDQITPGWGDILLRGDAPNGPGPTIYYHILVLEYAGAQLTQIAIPYASAASIDYGGLWIRGRYSGTWSAWRLYGGYDRFGSNANGNYIRFANGLQICWLYNLGIASGGTTWTYPAAFTAAPAVAVSGRGTYGTLKGAIYGGTPTTTSVKLATSETDTRIAGSASVIAIGKWK